jgi:Flp pilus assembly protein TadG
MSERLASWLPRRVRQFGASRRAATAIEFAIIAPILTGLLISVLETGVFFLAQQNLQDAAIQGGRLIMTGQAQTGGMTQSQFLAAVCPELQTLFTCANVMADVQTAASFSSATTAPPTLTYNANGTVSNNWNYNLGTDGGIVVVRLIYQWPLVSGPFSLLLPNLTNGTSLMYGVSAFKVEPY